MTIKSDLKFIALLSAIFFAIFAFSKPAASDNPYPDLSMSLNDVQTLFSATLPNTPVETVEATPVPGLYAIITSGEMANVLYFSPTTKHLIFGHIYTHTGTDLTTQTMPHVGQINQGDINGIDTLTR